MDTYTLGPSDHYVVAVALEDSVTMPEMMTHFLEQAGRHEAELKKKDEEIARLQLQDSEITRLNAEIRRLKGLHESELEKDDQEFAEKKERLTTQISKDKSLLQEAGVKLTSVTSKYEKLQAHSADVHSELQRLLFQIAREFFFFALA